ncbi:Clp protease N-terminal domain-containing protein [Actinosynnema sp. NPDC020468]|uniref:Clp protease N-terminal domain-containing protein n=1 Tax=Actinosynnema sp. NPDC020468 TaxID=3154488 RepID=UPI0033F29D75
MQPPVQLTDLIVTVAQEAREPLTRLAAAVELSARLGELGDHLIGHFVDEARRSGASWTDIGESIGVTKQAAQKRFVPKESTRPDFGRYTDRARRVVVLARHHARYSTHVGTGHLLLGLLDESGGQAAKTVAALEASEGTTRLVLLHELAGAPEERPDDQQFTAHAKKASELAVRASLRLGQPFVGTEHVLLGLLAEPDCTAARALAQTGVTAHAAEKHIRAEFERAISDVPRPRPRGA